MKSEWVLLANVLILLVVLVIGFFTTRDFISGIAKLNIRVTEIENNLNEHQRLKDLEKFARSSCIDTKEEACALLYKIEK